MNREDSSTTRSKDGRVFRLNDTFLQGGAGIL
jgi:hypothetical protein